MRRQQGLAAELADLLQQISGAQFEVMMARPASSWARSRSSLRSGGMWPSGPRITGLAAYEVRPEGAGLLALGAGGLGHVWSIRDLSRIQLWFCSCPNYRGAHAEDVIVPREVVDG